MTEQEHIDLQRRHKNERDRRICDRIKAVLLYDKGYSYSEIAQILLLDDESIRRHVQDYFLKHKLAPESGGSSSYLNQSEAAALKSHLLEQTYLYVKDICAYVNLHFGKIYTVSGMTKWLHAHRFCYKKPHGVPAKAEQQKQADFIDSYRQLKSSLGQDEALFFADCSHPQHQTRLAYGWILKGIRKAEKRTACQKRLNLIAALNLASYQIEYRKVDWVNADSLLPFLQQLIDANPDKSTLHVIWDNAGYHKSQKVQQFVQGTKIKLHYLPAYSPNLNPIERLWKIMHETVTYNRYYAKVADFTEGILNFFRNIQQHLPLIRQRINDNFQTLTLA